MRKSILSMYMAAGFILFAQSAMAGTQVYVTFGFPVVQFEMDGDCPYDEDMWVEGHYCIGHPTHIWVSGYWAPAWHNHSVCIQRPPVYHRFHCNTEHESYRHTSRQPSGYHYSGQGRHGYSDTRREGYNREQNDQQPRNNNNGNNSNKDKSHGTSNNQQNQHQGQHNSQGHDGYRSDNNWMNNLNNKVIKRQIHQVSQD